MSENPRLWLSGFWILLMLQTIADADWHSPWGVGIALIGIVLCPICSYWEFRQGIRDRRKAAKP